MIFFKEVKYFTETETKYKYELNWLGDLITLALAGIVVYLFIVEVVL